MLRAQRIRRWIWRLNGLLAVAACAGLGAGALQKPPEPFEPRSVELDIERESVVRGAHLPPFEVEEPLSAGPRGKS